MKNVQKNEKSFMDQIHKVGRWSSVISIITFIMNGVAICLYFDIFPAMSKALVSILLALVLLFVTGIVEFFSQLPILGSGATYVGYITGNVSNMKVPAVNSVLQIFKAEDGTENKEVLATIASCVSSLLVIVLLTVLVLFSGVLSPVLEWEPIQPAFTYIMPVLYGILLVPSLVGESGKYVLISMLVVAVLVWLGLPGTFMTFVGIPVGLVLFLVHDKMMKKKREA